MSKHTERAIWTGGIEPGSFIASEGRIVISVSQGVIHPSRPFRGQIKVFNVNEHTSNWNMVDNKWFSIVLWGKIGIAPASGVLFVSFPKGSYDSFTGAKFDSKKYTNYPVQHPDGFLIARYVVRRMPSGEWEEGYKEDLRGLSLHTDKIDLPQYDPDSGPQLYWPNVEPVKVTKPEEQAEPIRWAPPKGPEDYDFIKTKAARTLLERGPSASANAKPLTPKHVIACQGD